MQPFPLSDVPRDRAQRWGLPACHPGTQQALWLQPALAGLGQAPEPTLQPGPGTSTGALVDIVFSIHWIFDQSAKRACHAELSFVL